MFKAAELLENKLDCKCKKEKIESLAGIEREAAAKIFQNKVNKSIQSPELNW